MRDMSVGIYEFPNKYWLYDSSAVNNNKLVMDAEPICRFRARTVTKFGIKKVWNDNICSKAVLSGVIQTRDKIKSIKPNMYVKNQAGVLFVIDELPEIEYMIDNEQLSSRPTPIRNIKLNGIGEFYG